MNTVNEIWEPVKGFEGYYEVSNTGKVLGIERMVVLKSGLRTIKSRFLKTRINNYGYTEVRLTKDGKTTTTFIHILLAKAFIPNPYKKLEVNHINGIKTDNRIENLEWCTHSENINHAYQSGLLQKRGIKVVDICNNIKYSTIKDAALAMNINYITFKKSLKSKNQNNLNCLQYEY